MTATITEVVRGIMVSRTYNALSTNLGAITVLLLIALLIQKEIIRAYGNSRARTWMQVLDIAIAPLLIAFGLIVTIRFLSLLHLG